MKKTEIQVYKMWLEPYDASPLIVLEEDLNVIINEIKELDGDDVFSVQKSTMSRKKFENLKEHRGW